MTEQKEERLDRLERIVTEYIVESREERKEMRRTNHLLSTAILELANLQLQQHRDALNPAPAPFNDTRKKV